MNKYLLLGLIGCALASCTKEPIQSKHIQQTEAVSLEYENDADRYVKSMPENNFMSIAEIDSFYTHCQIWPKDVLIEFLNSPQKHRKMLDVKRRYDMLMQAIHNRDELGTKVETIVQLTPSKRIIDANAETVALTIAAIGLPTQGQFVGIDFYKTPQNSINNMDVYLAGWAYSTTVQKGSQFVAQDDYIEFQDFEPAFITEYSGGNYAIEAAIIYNGPTTQFSFFNVQTGSVEVRTIESGELMIYGPYSEYGELIFNLTLADENEGWPYYNSASIIGPIPGTLSGSAPVITLSGGPWPELVQ